MEGYFENVYVHNETCAATCGADGNWDITSPYVCVEIRCSDIKRYPLENGMIANEERKYPDGNCILFLQLVLFLTQSYTKVRS